MSKIKGKQIHDKTIGLNNLADEVVSYFDRTDPLEFSTQPVMTVTEGATRVDINNAEETEIRFQFTNTLPSKGALATIVVQFKRPNEIQYSDLTTFTVTEQSNNLTFSYWIRLEEKPQTLDFSATLLNTKNEPWKINGAIQTLYDSATFNGVPDVFEYVEATDLAAINTPDPEEGPVPGDVIKLRWTDLRTLERTAFPIESRDAFGGSYTITYELSRRIYSYVIYMFISDDGNPPSQPTPGIAALYGSIQYGVAEYGYAGENTVEQNGKWVFVGEYTQPYAEIKCPRGKGVMFWVGFKTLKTQTNLPDERVAY